MNKSHFNLNDFQRPQSLAVFTMILWLLERWLHLDWLYFFVIAGAIATLATLIWTIIQVWLRQRK